MVSKTMLSFEISGFIMMSKKVNYALDDAIYSTKKLVENCEMRAMLNQLVAGREKQRVAQAA